MRRVFKDYRTWDREKSGGAGFWSPESRIFGDRDGASAALTRCGRRPPARPGFHHPGPSPGRLVRAHAAHCSARGPRLPAVSPQLARSCPGPGAGRFPADRKDVWSSSWSSYLGGGVELWSRRTCIIIEADGRLRARGARTHNSLCVSLLRVRMRTGRTCPDNDLTCLPWPLALTLSTVLLDRTPRRVPSSARWQLRLLWRCTQRALR